MDGRAPRKRHEVEAALIERATKDEAFRRALIADPTGTLEREIGAKAPEGFSLTVVEETPEHRYLVLPPRPAGGGELSDSELESVAGGVIAAATVSDCVTVSDCLF
jgi:hypothetical protein